MKSVGFSKTAFYAIKNGKTKKFSEEKARRISEVYPNYSYKWLISDGKEILEKDKNNVLSKDQILFVVDALYNNEDQLKENEIFVAWKNAVKLEERERTYKDILDKRGEK